MRAKHALTNLYPHGRLKPAPADTAESAEPTEALTEASAPPLTYQKLFGLLKRPYAIIAAGVVVSASLGLCLLGGFYLLNESFRPAPLNENALAMVNLAPEPQTLDAMGIHDIITLINQARQTSTHELEEESDALTFETEPETTAKNSTTDEAFSMLGLQPMLAEVPQASGRPDPFEPLIREFSDGGTGPMISSEGIMASVIYTGFIRDSKSANHTAILDVGGTTLIKKAGDTFHVEGNKVVIKSISQSGIEVRVKGESHNLPISVNYEAASASSGSTTKKSPGTSSTSSSASGNSSPEEKGILELEEEGF